MPISKNDIDKALANTNFKDPILLTWETGFCIINKQELEKLSKSRQAKILNIPNMKPHKNIRRNKSCQP